MRTDHEIPIDRSALDEWLSIERNGNDDYQHLLLRQKSKGKWLDALGELSSYFEFAHADAREHFHRMAGLSLHPTRRVEDVQYPNSLPKKSRHGLFGETICGFLAECFRFLDDQPWQVPVFLFRYHQDADHYINRLARGGPKRQVVGRFGDDFLAIALNDDGTLAAILCGEAKFRSYLSGSKAKPLVQKIHEDLSADAVSPVNLMHMCDLLRAKGPEIYEAACLDLERHSLIGHSDQLERYDLICLVVDKTQADYPPTFIPQDIPHRSYTGSRKLQAIEVIIEEATTLVERLFDNLYGNGDGGDEGE